MKKRRNAYKRYDWKKHKDHVRMRYMTDFLSKQLCKQLDMAILYGDDAPVRIGKDEVLQFVQNMPK